MSRPDSSLPVDLPPGRAPEGTLPSADVGDRASVGQPTNAAVSMPHTAPQLRLPPAAMLTLKAEVIDNSPQRVRVRYPVQDGFLNPYGVLQGGFLSAMFDNVIGMCAYSLDVSRQSVTLEMSVRFFRSVRSGHIVIDGTVVRAGHTTVTVECVAWDDGAQLCAKAIATNLFVG